MLILVINLQCVITTFGNVYQDQLNIDNKKGFESLPHGIVQETSDLELKPLWINSRIKVNVKNHIVHIFHGIICVEFTTEVPKSPYFKYRICCNQLPFYSSCHLSSVSLYKLSHRDIILFKSKSSSGMISHSVPQLLCMWD